MRIVLITDEVSPDVAEAVRFARAHGVQEIAIRAVSDQAILALDEAAIDALVACVSELGAPVSSLLSPLFKAYLPGRSGPQLVDPNIPEFSVDASVHLAARERLPPLAARLGTDCVRVFSFLRERGAEAGLPDEARDLLAALEAVAARASTRSRTRTPARSAQSRSSSAACSRRGCARSWIPPTTGTCAASPSRRASARSLVERLADVHVKDMAGDDRRAARRR